MKIIVTYPIVCWVSILNKKHEVKSFMFSMQTWQTEYIVREPEERVETFKFVQWIIQDILFFPCNETWYFAYIHRVKITGFKKRPVSFLSSDKGTKKLSFLATIYAKRWKGGGWLKVCNIYVSKLTKILKKIIKYAPLYRTEYLNSEYKNKN